MRRHLHRLTPVRIALLAGLLLPHAPALAAPGDGDGRPRFGTSDGDAPRGERGDRPRRSANSGDDQRGSGARAMEARPAPPPEARSARGAGAQVHQFGRPDRVERVERVERDAAGDSVRRWRETERAAMRRGDEAARGERREERRRDAVAAPADWSAQSGDRRVERDARRSGGWQRRGDGRRDGDRDGIRDGQRDGIRDGIRDGAVDGQRADGRTLTPRSGERWVGSNGRRDWSRDWRRDQRYDWRHHRERNRTLFRIGRYSDPYGWSYRRWSIGYSIFPRYYRSSYWLDDPWMYRLPPVWGPYRWVRYYDDALLVDLRSGRVVDVIYGFFW